MSNPYCKILDDYRELILICIPNGLTIIFPKEVTFNRIMFAFSVSESGGRGGGGATLHGICSLHSS